MAKLFAPGLTQHFEKRTFTPITPGNYEGMILSVEPYAKEPIFKEDGEMVNATAIKGKLEITSGKIQADGSDPAGRKMSFFLNLPADGQKESAYKFFAERLQALLNSAGIEYDEDGFDFEKLIDKAVKFRVSYKRDKDRKIVFDDNGNKQTDIDQFLFDEVPEPSAGPSKSAPSNDGFDFN